MQLPVSGPQVAARFLLGLVAFALLDWATFTPSLAPLGITPWNPAIGLAFAFVLTGGRIYFPLLAIAPFVSDIIVRDLPFAWWVTAIEAGITGISYCIGLHFLLTPANGFDRTLHSIKDLVLLGAVAAACALVVAGAYNGILVMLGELPLSRLLESAVQYWVGDVIGITVMTPFLLLMAFRRDFPQMTLESIFQMVAILAAVVIVFGFTGKSQIQFSYMLLLPIVWVAVRYGFEGVSAGLLLMQICIMVAMNIGKPDAENISNFQAVMIVLAFSGLAIGVLTSERVRTERRLRLQQDAIARAARLGSMGELAAAIAHEINQPLTAAGNYARATVAALSSDQPRLDDARHAASRLIEQVDRSGQVIRRLRDLIRMGRVELSPHAVRAVIDESMDLMHHELAGTGVDVEVDCPSGLPNVMIDLLQVEQVLTNLIRNATEAVVAAHTPNPQVVVSARTTAGAMIEIAVADNGPGIPNDIIAHRGRTVESRKATGLGVGLSLCHSIIEAHGGKLTIENGEKGALVRFTVPTVGADP